MEENKVEFYKMLLNMNNNTQKISAKIATVQGKIKGLKKDSKSNVTASQTYLYLGGDKLYTELTKLLEEQKIALNTTMVPGTLKAKRHEYEKIGNNSGKPRKIISYDITSEWQFQFIDVESGEILQGFFPMLGSQDNDIAKAYGTARTYSDRYFLMKYFMIATDKDDAEAVKEEGHKVKIKSVDEETGEVTKVEDTPKETPKVKDNVKAPEIEKKAPEAPKKAKESKVETKEDKPTADLSATDMLKEYSGKLKGDKDKMNIFRETISKHSQEVGRKPNELNIEDVKIIINKVESGE